MQETQVLLQNFKFNPSELTLQVKQKLSIRVGNNQNQSQIYSPTERFFIISIESNNSLMEIEMVESDQLFENQTFDHTFEYCGQYTIKCCNYNMPNCRLSVVGERQMKQSPSIEIWEPLQETKHHIRRIPTRKELKNNKILSPRQRSFKVSEQEINFFVIDCEFNQSLHSDEEAVYMDNLYIQGKQKQKLVPPEDIIIVQQTEEVFNEQTKARSEQRFRIVEGDEDDDNDDCVSCYHDFSKQTQKRSKFSKRNQFRNPLVALSNADSLSTYHTYSQYHLHQQHSNKIDAQSTFSELCDQQPFTTHHEEKQLSEQQQQKVGRKNSDPLIQFVKDEQLSNNIKKYRFNKPAEIEPKIQVEFNSTAELHSSYLQNDLKSSESEKEFDQLTTFQTFFKNLIYKISQNNNNQSIDVYQQEKINNNQGNSSILQEYLDQDFLLALDFHEQYI